jgi:hypothetical protein
MERSLITSLILNGLQLILIIIQLATIIILLNK